MKTRSSNQCRSHYQKIILKYGDPENAIKHSKLKLGLENYLQRYNIEMSKNYGKTIFRAEEEESLGK